MVDFCDDYDVFSLVSKTKSRLVGGRLDHLCRSGFHRLTVTRRSTRCDRDFTKTHTSSSSSSSYHEADSHQGDDTIENQPVKVYNILLSDHIAHFLNMPQDDEAIRWCNDNLHGLIGFANDTLAAYLVSIASRKHSSETDLLQVLRDGGIEQSPERLSEFCRELIHKTRRSVKEEKKPSKKDNERNIRPLAPHSYDDLPPDTERRTSPNVKPDKQISKDTQSRKRSYRRDDSNSDSEEDESGLERYHRKMEERIESRLIKQEESKLLPEERAELERERDLKERDEFVQRMLEKDKSKTKDKVDVKTEEDEAHQKRLKVEERLLRGDKVVDEETGTEITIDHLREESRRAYLKKREERELELLKLSLQDEAE
jgi:pre-mRNA-splicing factor ATP-dependent RNA helicase DHX16